MELRHQKSKPRTMEERKTALFQMLVLRRSIDNLTADDLARTSGLNVQNVAKMLDAERERRRLRA